MALHRECSWAMSSTSNEMNSSARSSRTTAFKRRCRSRALAPTRRSKSACPNAFEELLQLWCGECLPTADCQRFYGVN